MSPHLFFLRRELPSPDINPTWHFQGDDHSVRPPCWYCFSIGVPSISYIGGWGRRVAKTVPRALPDSLIFVARMWRMPLPLGKEEGWGSNYCGGGGDDRSQAAVAAMTGSILLARGCVYKVPVPTVGIVWWDCLSIRDFKVEVALGTILVKFEV